MIDTHCHLTDPRILTQIDQVLSRAAAAGVTQAITIGTSISDGQLAIELCRRYPQLRCAVGIHPNYCHEAELGDIERLRELQSDPAVVAIGEMGLDYHYDFADRARQRLFFERQVALASELGKPVIIHCRQAVADALALLKGSGARGVVFHCFTGTPAEAQAILAAGHFISYTGVITFKKNDALRECVRLTPQARLMVETDAPYLSPEPFRSQKVNEPALVMHTAAVVAKTWDVKLEQVDDITTTNAQNFFGLAGPA